MYVNDGPLFWLLSSTPHLLAVMMVGAIVKRIVVLSRKWSCGGLAYSILYIVVCLAVIAGGYALVFL